MDFHQESATHFPYRPTKAPVLHQVSFFAQDEIHELLLSFAEAGATVLRLKGGDPLVFGRGGEEMDFLEMKGIHVQIVPGITAASGISASLGIPLTHRGVANSVRFLTGHSRKGGQDPLFVAGGAADPDTTLVVYMGLATLPALVTRLVESGLPADTPAVAVERGTTPEQRTVFGQLTQLHDLVQKAQLVSPTLLMIGQVVALSHLWPHGAKAGVGRISGKELPIGPRDRALRPAEDVAQM
jgi:uroporphyrin-III C-methyltransferase